MHNKLSGIALASVLIAGSAALAASKDYRFEVVQPPVRSACGSIATVRIIHTPSGQPVTDAEVFQRSSELVFNKRVPSTVVQNTPLKPDGQGNYRLIVGPPPKGETPVTLARVPAEPRIIRETAALGAPTC